MRQFADAVGQGLKSSGRRPFIRHRLNSADREKLPLDLAIATRPKSPAGQASPRADGAAPDFAALALKAQAAALAHERFQPAAMAFVTEVALSLGCDRVSLGVMENGLIRVVAVSHGGETEFAGVVGGDIADAMDEAVQQGCGLQLPESPQARPSILTAHRRLRSHLGGVVQTVPLRVRGDRVGAVCCEWSEASSITPLTTRPMENLVDLIGPVLWLTRLQERSWWQRLRDSAAHADKHLASEDGKGVRWLVALASGLLLAGVLVPVEQHVSAHSRLEGSIERAVVAPIEGFIETVRVRPGDEVRADQVVIELAAQDLRLEAQRWESELAQHESAYMASLARSERSEMMVSMSRAEEARARLGLARRMLDRTRIVAGMDGVVIAGDIGQLQGAPVSRGEVLLTIAPAGGYRAVLEVDERDVGRIAVGQAATMVLSADPDRRHPLRIARLTPMATISEGSNVFRVEAELVGDAAGLRPGLQGIARVAVGREPVLVAGWNWLADRLGMLWWRWGA